jgi:hypothetical protein
MKPEQVEKTMNTTDKQIEELVSIFAYDGIFPNPEACPGAPRIATCLFRDGSCIVAGNGKLWHGFFGNFVNICDAETAVGCARLTLDMGSFLASEYAGERLRFKLLNTRHALANLRATEEALVGLLKDGGHAE